MSFDFGNKTENPTDQKPFGVDETRLATNELGRVVPWHCGTARLSVTFISEVFSYYTEEITTKVGKGKRATTGHNYYSSFAGLVCHGIGSSLGTMGISEISFDDEVVWTGAVTDSGADYTDITITSRGVLRIYWGTNAQTLDDQAGSTDDLTGSGQTHAPYRGVCYIVGRQILWGANHSNIPNIEIVISRFPNPSWLTPSPEIDDDCNPIAAVWDLWTNTRAGMGLAESLMDTTALDAVAVTLNTEGLGLTMAEGKGASFRDFIGKLAEYIDCFHYTTSAGKFAIGLKRSTDSAVIALDESDLVEPPDIKPPAWDETSNETFLVFTDRDREFEENELAFRDRSNFAIVDEPKAKRIQRPWITKGEIAQQVLAAWGRRLAWPAASGRLKIRQSQLGALKEGDLFTLTFAAYGVTAKEFRCIELVFPSPESPIVEITFDEDIVYLNDAAYVPTIDALPPITTWTPSAATYDDLIELPCALTRANEPGEAFSMGVLVGRPNTSHDGLKIYMAFSSYFEPDVEPLNYWFARRGTLSANYSGTTDNYDETGTLDATFDTPETTLELGDETDLGRWVLYCEGEFILPFNETLQSAKRWTMSAVRGRFGSEKLAHSSGVEVWLFETARLPRILRGIRVLNANNYNVKVQPTILNEGVDLSGVTAMAATPTGADSRPPTPKNLRDDATGNGINPTYATSSNAVVAVDDVGQCVDLFQNIGNSNPPKWADTVILELWDSSTKQDEIVFSTAASYTVTNAEIISIMGGEVDFWLRCYMMRSGVKSTNYDGLKFTKI